MREIKELILLLKQHHVQSLKHLADEDSKSKIAVLYEGIASNKFKTDEAAARFLYGEAPEGSKYRKLKSDLRDHLLEAAYRLNMTEDTMSDYQQAYYECNRLWITVRVLAGHNSTMAALYLANRLLKRAAKFDFTLICMDLASYLRVQYGLREGNDKKFKEACDLFEHYSDVYRYESEAETLYTTLAASFVNVRSGREEMCSLAETYYEQISPALHRYPTYRLHMYGRMIGLSRYTAMNNHEKILEYCEESIAFFNSRPYEARVPLQMFYYQSLISNVQTCNFNAGQIAAEQCRKLAKEGTFNWFKYRELHLLLFLRTGHYNEGGIALYETISHDRFEFLPNNVKEIWRIYEAYVCWLAEVGAISRMPKSKFKWAKFLNEVAIFSKDKRGVNVSILAIKLLFLLQEGQYGPLLDELELVDQYCYRYLRGEHTQRSFYFVKMLLQIPAGHFDKEVVIQKSEKYYEKLLGLPIQVAEQMHEIEIVPYEVLWKYALGLLEVKPKARRGTKSTYKFTASMSSMSV